MTELEIASILVFALLGFLAGEKIYERRKRRVFRLNNLYLAHRRRN